MKKAVFARIQPFCSIYTLFWIDSTLIFRVFLNDRGTTRLDAILQVSGR